MTAQKEENTMKQTPNMNRQNKNHSTGGGNASSSMTVLFVIAALIVLLVVLFFAARGDRDVPMCEVKIKELTAKGMVVESDSGRLGKGEVRLACADDVYVEDINGQEIDYAELKASDAIRVSVKMENLSGSIRVDRIILLPDDRDEYI